MAKSELGTKRIDPETGRKFYDLNKDLIVSPYTGKAYPRSYFDDSKIAAILEEEEEVETKELDPEEESAEAVSLEDHDDEVKAGDDLPDLVDNVVDLGDDDDSTFLAEEEDDDVSDMIGGDDET